jgi:lipopolysaccharide heptosyltransferase I
VVVVRLSALGDVVHALPSLELLRAALPQAELTWLVEPLAAPLLQGHPALDRVVVLDRPGLRTAGRRRQALRDGIGALRAVRRLRADAALDLQGLARSAVVARASGARRVFGPAWAREGARFLYNQRLQAPRPGEAHAVQRYAQLVRGALDVLGLPCPDGLPPARLPFPAVEPRPKRLAMLVGAGKAANRLPPDLLAQVADRLHEAVPELEVVLLGGAADVARGAAVVAAAKLARPRSRCGELSIPETAAELASAALVLGADTGCLHLARALGRPVLGLFPAADPERTGPAGLPGEAPALVLRGQVDCAPCLARTCRRPDGVRVCLRDLPAERVAESARSLLIQS